jgi:uncharacterized membrane protein YeaQ/YmgE (transglycosylase-associated protein family)
MDFVILIAGMILVGLLVGWIAGFIWKDNRPIGVRGDYITAVVTAIALGLMDWYLIPAMGFSDSLRNLGVASEPALGGLLVLWFVRLAKRK